MTASAAAARLADATTIASLALTFVVSGGLVEGMALGWAQSLLLSRWLPGLRRARYVAATLLVAGIGWVAASAPAVLAADEPSGPEPPLVLVLAGAAGIGLVMGPVLGAAQAWALRGAAAGLARWVWANLVAWPPAMMVIFLGATTPTAATPTVAVVGLGALTGAIAGTLLGVLTSIYLPEALLPASVGNDCAGRNAAR